MDKKNRLRKILTLLTIFISIILFLLILIINTKYDNYMLEDGIFDMNDIEYTNNFNELDGQWYVVKGWVDLDSPDSSYSLGDINKNSGVFALDNTSKMTYKMTLINNDESTVIYFKQTSLIKDVFINGKSVYEYDKDIIKLSDIESNNGEYEIIIYAINNNNDYNHINDIQIIISNESTISIILIVLSQIKYILIGFYLTVMLIGYILGRRSKDNNYLIFFIFLGFLHVVLYYLFIPPFNQLESYIRSNIALNEMWNIFSYVSLVLQIIIIFRLFNKHVNAKLFYATAILSFISLCIYLVTGIGVFQLLSSLILVINYLFILYNCIIDYFAGEYYSVQIFIVTNVLICVEILYYEINYLHAVTSYVVLFDYFFVYRDLTLFFGIMIYFFKRFSDDYTVSKINSHTLSEEVKKQNRELTFAYEQLKGMEESRTNMLNNIAHDIRTPITSILTYLELINDGVIDKGDVNKYIPKMLLRINHIKNLSGKLYEVMNFENSDDRFTMLKYSTKLLFDDLEIMLIDEKKYKFVDIDVANRYFGYVLIDYAYVVRVFTNLIDNAYRYVSKDGSGKISITSEEYDEDFVLFKVVDNGEGIPKEEIPKVFGRFYRIDYSRGDTGDHQGLGLTICYEVIKYHGGDIWVESEMGRGAAFMFTVRKQKE